MKGVIVSALGQHLDEVITGSDGYLWPFECWSTCILCCLETDKPASRVSQCKTYTVYTGSEMYWELCKRPVSPVRLISEPGQTNPLSSSYK